MKSALTVLLLSLAFVFNAHAGEERKAANKGIKISEIKFIGSSAFSTEMLLDSFRADSSHSANGIANLLSSDTSRIEQGLTQIQNMYYSGGYLFFKVDSLHVVPSSDSSIAALSIYISEGPRLLIGKLLISGNTFFNHNGITSDLETRVGQPFDQGNLEKDIDATLSKYNAAGFPLTKISIDSVFVYGPPVRGSNVRQDDGADSLGIALTISEGKRFRIDAVRIEGNAVTKNYVILRALRIGAGTYYNEDAMADAKQRLQKLGFFQSVSDPEIFESGDTTGVLVKVAEGNTNTFDGIVGYVPAQLGQSGYFTGMIDVSMLNLFGTGANFAPCGTRKQS